MNKIVIIGVLCSILLSFLPLISASDTNSTIYVDDDGEADVRTIQEALDIAKHGDTIFVYSGMYEECNLIINTSITVQGENPTTTSIQGDGSHSILRIYANQVNISGFTLTNGGDMMDACISILANDCLLTQNIIDNCNNMGISLHNSSSNIIQNNIISNCSSAAIRFFQNNTKNFISNNSIKNNLGPGVYCERSHENTIVNNTFKMNIEGIQIHNSDRNMISQNTVDESLIGIYLFQSSHQLIQKNKIFNCSDGIYIEESNENVIHLNHIRQNQQGIIISYASDNLIQQNNLIKNTEQAKFTTWLSPDGLPLSRWDENYWDDAVLFFPKIIPGILFIPTNEGIGVFIPWVLIDWHPASNLYEI